MSYWSQRRAAERAAVGHEPARPDDERVAPVATHDAFGVEMVRPVIAHHPVTVTSPRRRLRERAAELEQTIWVVPTPDPDVSSMVPSATGLRTRSRW